MITQGDRFNQGQSFDLLQTVSCDGIFEVKKWFFLMAQQKFLTQTYK